PDAGGSDPRASDGRRSVTRVSDARPSDARPSDARPSDARPSGARPSDGRPPADEGSGGRAHGDTDPEVSLKVARAAEHFLAARPRTSSTATRRWNWPAVMAWPASR